jgi:VWFA-related protein
MRRSLLHAAPLAPLLAGLLLGLAVPAARARPADAPTEPPVFGDELEVRVVDVEAVVTDKQGNRVSGLKPGDFRLRVDGKEVPIEYFSEVKDGRSLAPDAASPTSADTAKPEAGVQPLTEGPVGTYYLVFVDDYFSIAQHRNVVLKAIKDQLGRLGPEDRMAVVAYDGGRLAMLSNWSGSKDDLARALDQAAARTPHGFDRRKDLRSFESDEAFADQVANNDDEVTLDSRASQLPGLSDEGNAFADMLIRQIKGDVQAAVGAMRAFAAPRGRKVMLLLSGGWPFSVPSFLSGGSQIPNKGLPGGEEVFKPLVSTANLLGYTLYPVDVPGLQKSGSDVEDTAVFSGGAANLGQQEIHESLDFLAKETGGKALVNSNRTLALATASADTRSFYWLGFSPTWKHDDKPHQIRLEPVRKDLTIRSRSGFLDLSRQAEVSMKVESALLFGNLPGAQPMPMKLGTLVRSRRGETEVPITLGLPVSLMTVVPVNGKYAVKLELRFAASDSAGNSSEIPVVPVTLTSDHPPTPGKLVRYETKIKLRGTANHLVVAVYDPLNGKVASAQADLGKP